MKTFAAAIALVTGLSLACAALAEAPQPKKPFDAARMPGRWYEIARTPNRLNRDCQGGTTDWVAAGPGRFRITAVCRKGSPSGPARTISGTIRILDGAANTKLRMSLLGGLVSGDYWLIDRADDYGWLIMGTPGGGFVALFSTRPKLEPAARADALGRLKAMGYDVSRLAFPLQPPG